MEVEIGKEYECLGQWVTVTDVNDADGTAVIRTRLWNFVTVPVSELREKEPRGEGMEDEKP